MCATQNANTNLWLYIQSMEILSWVPLDNIPLSEPLFPSIIVIIWRYCIQYDVLSIEETNGWNSLHHEI